MKFMLTAVTGINWGDEGKGRVIDLLAENADIVAVAQGTGWAGRRPPCQKGSAFGSTRRGIAYAYSDKYRKKTLRLGDLLHLDEQRTQNRLHMILDAKNMELAGCYHQEPMSYDALLNWCRQQAAYFAPFICDVGAFLQQAHDNGKRIVLEAQLGRAAQGSQGLCGVP